MAARDSIRGSADAIELSQCCVGGAPCPLTNSSGQQPTRSRGGFDCEFRKFFGHFQETLLEWQTSVVQMQTSVG